MKGKTLRTILLTLFISLITFISFSTYAYSEESNTEFKQLENMIIFEKTTVDKFFTIQSIYKIDYNEIRVCILYNHTDEVNEGDLEKYYQDYMYNWIRDERHRFYDFKTVTRKRFYNKNIGPIRYNTYDVYAILKK